MEYNNPMWVVMRRDWGGPGEFADRPVKVATTTHHESGRTVNDNVDFHPQLQRAAMTVKSGLDLQNATRSRPPSGSTLFHDRFRLHSPSRGAHYANTSAGPRHHRRGRVALLLTTPRSAATCVTVSVIARSISPRNVFTPSAPQ